MSSFNCENNDVKQLTVYLMLGRPLKWVDSLPAVESPSITRLIRDGKLENGFIRETKCVVDSINSSEGMKPAR